tara:strand:+ start:18174 stop:18623 length:450 start_codon:yes stop_codon:yes gene_type:complete
MSWLSSAAKKLKKAAKKLTFKKHGTALLGLGAASLIPGVGGLLGKALGTGQSGFMGGLLTKEGAKSALLHHGKKHLKSQLGGLDVGGLLNMVNPQSPDIAQQPNMPYQFVNPAFQQFNTQPTQFSNNFPDSAQLQQMMLGQNQQNMSLY